MKRPDGELRFPHFMDINLFYSFSFRELKKKATACKISIKCMLYHCGSFWLQERESCNLNNKEFTDFVKCKTPIVTHTIILWTTKKERKTEKKNTAS